MHFDSASKIKNMLDSGASKIDAAYYVIREMILQNELKASQILVERELSGMLGISRTPIRSALHRLSYEGFAALRPDGSIMVSRLDVHEILELYEVREALECKAVELFIKRKTKAKADALSSCLEEHRQALENGDKVRAYEFDNEMHFIIADGSENRHIQSALNAFITMSLRSLITGALDNRRYDDSLAQHKAVVDAIIEGDSKLAADCMRLHFEDVKSFFKIKLGGS